jgi:toxin CcdB
MTQFTAYKNKNPRSKVTYPLLLDVQADLLDDLQTRIVIPLTKAPSLTKSPLRGSRRPSISAASNTC